MRWPCQKALQRGAFWRSLEERAGDPAFRERLYNEFPSQIEAITDPVQRRTFLKLMGASLALAGVTACTKQPAEKIVPYVKQPEELIPGKPLFYATAMALGGVATGLLVESHEGRPTKIEGNPMHPGSLGATDVFAQAAILGLYDPDRSQTLRNLGEIRPWSSFLGAINAALTAQQPLKGAGLRILTESVNSPTLAAQIRELLSRFPSAKWQQWDPASRDNARAGSALAFGGEFVTAVAITSSAALRIPPVQTFSQGMPSTGWRPSSSIHFHIAELITLQCPPMSSSATQAMLLSIIFKFSSSTSRSSFSVASRSRDPRRASARV